LGGLGWLWVGQNGSEMIEIDLDDEFRRTLIIDIYWHILTWLRWWFLANFEGCKSLLTGIRRDHALFMSRIGRIASQIKNNH
jgi:hypothetical protein